MFPPCPFPAQLPELREAPAPAPVPATGAKSDRDASGPWPHQRASTNFIVKWGSSGGVEDADADAVLALFETAWSVEIDQMGHAPPAGAATWRFNVYLGDTGDGTPPTYGYAGYYTVDAEGWPMVVLNPAALAGGYASGTTAHEFYHAVQHATGAYLEDPDAAWWWEATAMWVEGEVWPDDPDESTFTFGFGLAPQLPLWWDERFEDGNLTEYHPYGAFLFPRFLTDIVGDRALVTGTWTDAAGAATPQARLAQRLDFGATFGSFIAHNARWDYPDGALYGANVDAWRDTFGDDVDAGEVAARMIGPGATGGMLVHGGGYVQVDLVDPGDQVWTATVSPADGAELVGAVVRDTSTGLESLPLLADEAGGLTTTWTSSAAEGATRVVIGALTPADVPWAVTLVLGASDPVEEESVPPEDTGQGAVTACGCTASPPAPLGMGVLALVALTRRRVRPRAPSPRWSRMR